MGTHARPRRRVRAAALGTLAVGATLTGVGLTAAALDSSGAALADGTQNTDPVNFTASGLGAPVPVADVSSLDGSSVGKDAVVAKSGVNDATNTTAVLGAPLGGYGQYAASGKSAAAKATGQATSATSSGTARVKQVASTVTTSRGDAASSAAPAGNTGSGSDAASTDGGAPTISAPATTTTAPSGTSSSRGGSKGTSTLPAAQIPSLDASLPISTALPVPSLPTIANLSTAVGHAKSTVAGLLNEVAGLV